MILPSNYDEIDFDALYRAQKARSSFGKKIAADWDKKAPSFNEGVMKSAYACEFIDKVDFTGVSTLLDFACGTLSLKRLHCFCSPVHPLCKYPLNWYKIGRAHV